MVRKGLVILVGFFLINSLTGCATARKQKDLEIQGLRNEISALQTQVQTKEDEINTLKESLFKAEDRKTTVTQNFSKKGAFSRIKSRPTIKHIQIALTNAGYNPGRIDGKEGKETKQAVRDFQKANGLHVDGRVGKKTWVVLRKYLYEKVK